MSFKFRCPVCQQELEAQEEWRGMQLACPHCQKNITVPPRLSKPVMQAPGKQIQTACAFCHSTFEVDSSYIGQAIDCPACGKRFIIQPAGMGQPMRGAQPVRVQPVGVQPVGARPSMAISDDQRAIIRSALTSSLISSICVTLLCCLPFGIASIVYAVQANTAYNANNIEQASLLIQQSKKWYHIALISGLLFSALYAAVTIFAK